MRRFRSFTFKDTNLKVLDDKYDIATEAVVKARKELERYIKKEPRFQTSLFPVELSFDAPKVAVNMDRASKITNIGPMASVAGALAQIGAEAAVADGAVESVIENGGDMFIGAITEPLLVGLYFGNAMDNFSFVIEPQMAPLAICSSSSKMGHSKSFGNCDLVTVLSKDAALADSAATMICNNIKTEDELSTELEKAGKIDGIKGILAVKDKKIAMWGTLPKLIKTDDKNIKTKITKDRFGKI